MQTVSNQLKPVGKQRKQVINWKHILCLPQSPIARSEYTDRVPGVNDVYHITLVQLGRLWASDSCV